MSKENVLTVIVTGAADGIGRGICLELGKNGMNVVVNYHTNHRGAKEVAKQIVDAGANALLVQTDVTDELAVQKMVEKTMERFGSIDVLINNAGITEPEFVTETSLTKWDRMLKNNLTSAFICSKAVLGHMMEKRSGVILNVSSICGKTGGLGAGVHYSAAKAGMIGLTKGMADHLASYNIRVNAIAPAMIKSRMIGWRTEEQMEDVIKSIPLGRLGEIEEVAALVCYLVSDKASFITGATVDINGGLFME